MQHLSIPNEEMAPRFPLGARLAVFVKSERQQWLQWYVVGFGMGVTGYFNLAFEPPVWISTVLVLIMTFVVLFLRSADTWSFFATVIFCSVLGFANAQWRAVHVSAPVIESEIEFANVTGRIAVFEPQPNGYRVILEDVVIDDLTAEQTPERVRLTIRAAQDDWIDVGPGDWIEGLAGLSPPSPPAMPGGFDFQRRAWFQRLGAVGFGYGQPRKVVGKDQPGTSLLDRLRVLRTDVEFLRQRIYRRVSDQLSGRTGAVAAALMVGERRAVPEDTQEALRRSGLAHLLAISGLHLGLLAGLVFFIVRGCLAAFPVIALRYPIKKWAAFAALSATLIYLFLAGATVPTQRAFAMLTLVLGAIMIDRTALSMRLVAWAAAVILLIRPESLLGASFQLSFAAVIALIAGYEAIGDRWRSVYGGGGPIRRAGIYLGGVALTTIIAGGATAPFALHIFNRIAVYGVAANLVAVPIVALWVMPFALLAAVLMPFGLEFLALVPMGWGIDIVLAVADNISALPGSTRTVRSFPEWGFALLVMGGLWIALWRTKMRLVGLPAIFLGLASIATVELPDILIAHDGSLVGIRESNKTLLVSNTRRNSFTREMWREALALESVRGFPDEGTSEFANLTCDGLGCVYEVKETIVAIVFEHYAFEDDCRLAEIVIALVPAPEKCTAPSLVVDFFDLYRNGAHAIWLNRAGAPPKVSETRRIRGDRPWVIGTEIPLR
jgi:competence protein ComEC